MINKLKVALETHKKIIIVIFVVIFLALFSRLIFEGLKLTPVLFQLLFDKEIKIKKAQAKTNINLLGLGIGGGRHDGPNLTDTVMFININEEKNTVTLVSIPRDLWVPEIKAKINTVYAYGEERKKGEGLTLSKKALSGILNQPIDYGIRIDFDGFVKAVDLIGGLNIEVEHVLEDYEYPIAGSEIDTCGHTEEEVQILATSSAQLEAFPCRYEYFHVSSGLQHMDGETALKFVRSRHARGTEGTDFARSKRQAKVISAFREKILSLETLLNPIKVMSLYDTVRENIDTDIEQMEFDDFIKLFQKMRGAKIKSIVLDFGDETTKRPGLLTAPMDATEYKNQWVLIPRLGNGDFSEIQKYINCEIKGDNCLITPNPTIVKSKIK